MLTEQFDDLHAAAKTERHTLAAERDQLTAERRKLLQAHYADAIPLDLLKNEQDRIGRRLAHLDARINATDTDHAAAEAHLEDCLALAGDCHAIYMSIDNSLRRIANQAFFERINVRETDTIDSEPGEPFNVLFDPAVQADALRRYQAATHNRRSPLDARTADVEGVNNTHWVGAEGLEPPTPAL